MDERKLHIVPRQEQTLEIKLPGSLGSRLLAAITADQLPNLRSFPSSVHYVEEWLAEHATIPVTTLSSTLSTPYGELPAQHKQLPLAPYTE